MSIANNFPEIRPSLSLDFANTKKLDDRVTFARASEARYYDGVTTAKAEENLLYFSQALATSPWTQLRATRTNDADTAPDGTSTATAITQATGETASGQAQLGGISVVAETYTMSVFAKPNGKNFLQLVESLLDGTTNRTWFNVSNGTIGTTDAGHTATITASTEGFYRCSITFTVNAARTGTFIVSLADTDGSTTVVDSGGILAWGAQLEQRSAVTAYTPTTTQPITNYIPTLLSAPANTARFDHNPVTGESLGLLVEEQRTNLVLRSEEFDNASWTKSNSTIASNTVVAPDGTLTGDKLVSLATTAAHFTLQAFSKTAQAYTASIFAKKGELRYLDVGFSGVVNWEGAPQAKFDLELGEVTLTGSLATTTILEVGNGWYECILVSTSLNTTGSGLTISGSNLSGQIFPSYTGDGYSGIYIWGAQIEAGAFPTSYIKTEASQVTRSADSASMTGANFSDWYRADAGSFYVNAQAITGSLTENNTFRRIFSVNSGSNANVLQFVGVGDADIIRFEKIVNNVFTPLTSDATPANVFEYSASYEVGSYASSLNGANVGTSSATGLIPVVSQLNIGSQVGGTENINGHIKKLSYYPARLTNTQLQALTS